MSQTKSHYGLDLHFYPELKASIEARARYHSFPLEIILNTPLDELHNMVRDHELELSLLWDRAKEEGRAMVEKASVLAFGKVLCFYNGGK